MVKIERQQELAASDKCLSVMGKRLFYKFIRNVFCISLNTNFI